MPMGSKHHSLLVIRRADHDCPAVFAKRDGTRPDLLSYPRAWSSHEHSWRDLHQPFREITPQTCGYGGHSENKHLINLTSPN